MILLVESESYLDHVSSLSCEINEWSKLSKEHKYLALETTANRLEQRGFARNPDVSSLK